MTASLTKGHLVTGNETRDKVQRQWQEMSFVCPLWNQVLYQTCVCERHTVTGPLSCKKLIHKYGDTLWGDNKSYVIMLLLTGTALQTKQWKQAEHTCKEAGVGVQIHMYTVNLLQKCLFPIPLSSVVSHKTGHWEGGHVQSIVPGVPDPVGCLSSTAVTSHTRDTSLFSGYEEPAHKTKGRDRICKISNTTHQEVDI